MAKKKVELDSRILKLTAIFRGLEPAVIDFLVERSRTSAIAETWEEREKELGKLFDVWRVIWKQIGCQAIADSLYKKKSEAIKRMLRIWRKKYPNETLKSLASKGIHLGIPVIRKSQMGLYGLMSMLQNVETRGYTQIDPDEIIDHVGIFQGIYVIYDVEDGRCTLGHTADQAKHIIKASGRQGLSEEESISMCIILTDVLTHHNIHCIGSCRKVVINDILAIFCDEDKQAILCWSDINQEHAQKEKWGTPSCVMRK